MIRNLVLYYFSGTGNTYRTASWMKEDAQARGAAAQVIPIDAPHPLEALNQEDTLIGLLAPTHAFCAPLAMIWFALRLPRPNHPTQAFTLLTRAGTKIGRWFFPGLEGSGAYLLALILALKGYQVVGVTGLDMPCSWTTLLPGYSVQTAQEIIDRSRGRSAEFLQALLNGQTRLRGWLALLLGLALTPVTLRYLVVGHFFLAKLNYASADCNGCGLCARACPVNGIRMRGKAHPRPYWTYACLSCTRCRNYCPRNAVEASYPLAALILWVTSFPLVAWLLTALTRLVGGVSLWQNGLVGDLLSILVILTITDGLSLLFMFALRLPWFNRLVTLLTPAHYYRRYHEPQTRITDLLAAAQPKKEGSEYGHSSPVSGD